MRMPLLSSWIRGGLLAYGVASIGVQAETLVLKEKSSITGRILAEKKDLVVVDVGYTVLSVPKSQIVRVLKTEEPEPGSPAVKPSRPAASPAPQPRNFEARRRRVWETNAELWKLVTELFKL